MINCIFEDGISAGETGLRHVCADTIVLKDKQILLVKRVKKLLEGNKWGIVGGYVNRNETVAEAAAREVMEETGYKVKNLKLLQIIDNPNRPNEDRQNIAFVYSCEALEKVGMADDESSEQKWFDLDKLPPPEEFAFDHYQDIQKYLTSNELA